ncbi:MAG: hypothetical protein GY862_38815 [Gammaproteobacteria bacterium]|nr:hypothetical protein [Gammaproteobacteria bacterium]
MLDRILLHSLHAEKATSRPMQADGFEKARAYRGWPLPLRYLLALRYLQRKGEVLNYFRLKRIYPVPEKTFQQRLRALLAGETLRFDSVAEDHIPLDSSPKSEGIKKQRLPAWAWPLRALFLYPLLLVCALGLGWLTVDYLQVQRLEKLLANNLVQYADLLHRNIENRVTGDKKAEAELQQQADAARREIIAALPERGQVRSKFNTALQSMGNPEKTAEQLLAVFAELNREMDDHDLPYYFVPKTYIGSCISFVTLPFELHFLIRGLADKLAGENPALRDKCRTTALIVYKVKEKQNYLHQGDELPLFYTARLDRLPVSESALGLTYYSGPGSLVLTDKIRRYSTDAILPALTRPGRKLIMPFWLDGNYSIEDAAAEAYKLALKDIYKDNPANLRELKKAAKTLVRYHEYMARARFRHSLLRVDHRLGPGGGDNWLNTGLDALSMVLNEGEEEMQDPLLGELPAIGALEKLMTQAVSYHEVYHQVRHKNGWDAPDWAATLLADLDAKGRDRALDELEAYLVGLYYAKKVHTIQLTQLFFFSLNVLMEREAEYYAARILLPALYRLHKRKSVFRPELSASPLGLFGNFKALKAAEEQNEGTLARLAGQAYEKLFRRAVPELYPVE